ncbi:hypothetical protein HXA31_01045 [Salipaludibacillus agaradhaerens]|uniref:Uncharacterized protein n=1 Tax=Salipaludibacillus agaradhaerens TaxID=76935 RepID=A0A9Q4B3P5_SALAG|nr:hypothetical protein [Salipaludibacillus agaradhaerens]MCR6097565.1 hypothetical protein [Salipaludibacillus agaradhaerens]MCR6112951.1 hypothetical protein [Salipaludibacillus agaradhaerens]
MKDMIKCLVFMMGMVGGIISVLMAVIYMTALLMPTDMSLMSWQALWMLAMAIFVWLIPVQFIDLLKLIPIQRRMRRIVYPHLLTVLQITSFTCYMVVLNSWLKNVAFSSKGLIIFTFVIICTARFSYYCLVCYLRKQAIGRVTTSR